MRKILLILIYILCFYSFANRPYNTIGNANSKRYLEVESEFKLICDSILKSQKKTKSSKETDIVAAISDYIIIKCSSNKETVNMNGSFLIDLIFTNISNKTVAFYPKGYLAMSHIIESEDMVFATYPNYCLRAFPDFRDLRYLSPSESLTETYEIYVEPDFFQLGENKLEILYSSYDYTNKKLKKLMKLYGVLGCSEFSIIVDSNNEHE